MKFVILGLSITSSWGTLINEYLARGGEAVAVPKGVAYVDVGTLHGYREALRLLSAKVNDDFEGRDVQLQQEQLHPQIAGL